MIENELGLRHSTAGSVAGSEFGCEVGVVAESATDDDVGMKLLSL